MAEICLLFSDTLLIMVVAISAISALYVWRRRAPWYRTGALLLLAGAVWLLGYALELGGAELPTKIFWNKVQYIGMTIVPTAWLILVLQYTGREKWLTRRNLALLSIVPLITLLLVFTNEAHGLIWSYVVLDTDGPFLVLEHPLGVGFWGHVVYSYILVLIAALMLVQVLIRSRHLYRWQANALLFAVSVSLVGSGLQMSELNPFPYLDLTVVAFSLTSLMVAWTLPRLRLGDIMPVARGTVIEGMGDGVVVLDAQNRIVDLNPAAQRLIGHTLSEAVGQPVEQVWPEWPGPMELPWDKAEVSREVVLGKGGGQRTHDLHISPITDWRGRLISQVVVLRDITERVRAEEALRDSERSYRLLAENVTDVIWTMDMNGRYTYFSPSITRLRGYSVEEAIAQTMEEVLTPTSLEVAVKAVAEELTAEQVEQKDLSRSRMLELELKCKDGSTVWTEVKMTALRDPNGRPVGILGVTRDIAERKRAEEQIKASLREKEVLLKEIHHRVKNNLQVISSLLYLQSKGIEDDQALEMYRDSEGRVRSIALVHEMLYQSQDLARTDFAEYVRSLATDLFRSYGVNAKVIQLKINVEGVFLGVDMAIPCGLIINELVSNSLKHAFPDGRAGEIRIELCEDNEGQFILMVSDDGVGFPKGLDFRNPKSLGLQLVNTLVDQLEGAIELDRSGGTAFKITFAEPEPLFRRGKTKT